MLRKGRKSFDEIFKFSFISYKKFPHLWDEIERIILEKKTGTQGTVIVNNMIS